MSSNLTIPTILTKVTLSKLKKIILQLVLKYDSIFDGRRLYESVLINNEVWPNWLRYGIWDAGSVGSSPVTSTENYGDVAQLEERWTENPGR